MMDELSREPMLFEAWELLKPEERPEHLSVQPTWRTGVNWFMDDAVSDGGPVTISRWSARDRLIVAVENALMEKYGGMLSHQLGYWYWHMPPHDDPDCYSDPDRFTAALAALRSRRVRE